MKLFASYPQCTSLLSELDLDGLAFGLCDSGMGGPAWATFLNRDSPPSGSDRLGQADGYYAQQAIDIGCRIDDRLPRYTMIFMGQEFLEYQPWSDADGTCLDWSRVDSFSGIVSLYRRLFQLRRNWGNNTAGLAGAHTEVLWADHATNLIVFRRWDRGGAGDDVLVIAKLSAHAQPSYDVGFPAAGRGLSDLTATGPVTRVTSAISATILRRMAVRICRSPRVETWVSAATAWSCIRSDELWLRIAAIRKSQRLWNAYPPRTSGVNGSG